MQANSSPQNNSHLKYAIIGGAASIARTHIAALQKLGAPIVALADINAEEVEKRAAQIGCPAFTDHHDMLAKIKPDVAVICTPHPSHVPIAIDCFAAGLHVLLEKPMAVQVAEADRVIAAADKAGR